MENLSLKIVLICTIAFIVQVLYPGFEEHFLLISSDIFQRPWILVTSMFLHGNIMHLFYNMFALGLFGTMLEKIIGQKRFLIIYFFGGITASILSTFFYHASLGASGAIMAVLGTLAVLRPRLRVYVGYVPMPMAVAAIVWIVGDFIGLFTPSNVANAAHLGGIFFGLLSGIVLKRQFGEKPRRRIRQIPESVFRKWEDKWM